MKKLTFTLWVFWTMGCSQLGHVESPVDMPMSEMASKLSTQRQGNPIRAPISGDLPTLVIGTDDGVTLTSSSATCPGSRLGGFVRFKPMAVASRGEIVIENKTQQQQAVVYHYVLPSNANLYDYFPIDTVLSEVFSATTKELLNGEFRVWARQLNTNNQQVEWQSSTIDVEFIEPVVNVLKATWQSPTNEQTKLIASLKGSPSRELKTAGPYRCQLRRDAGLYIKLFSAGDSESTRSFVKYARLAAPRFSDFVIEPQRELTIHTDFLYVRDVEPFLELPMVRGQLLRLQPKAIESVLSDRFEMEVKP